MSRALRVSALWKINDDWNILLQQNYQDMKVDGYFYAYPTRHRRPSPASSIRSPPSRRAFNKDRYESTAWTVNGKIGNILDVVYTGSYMIRHIEGQQDYSNYMRSLVGSYYACIGTGRRLLQLEQLSAPDRAPRCSARPRWATGTTRSPTSTRATKSA